MVFISSECKSQPGIQREPAPSLGPVPLLVYICQIWAWTASPRPPLGQVHGGGICGGSRGQRPILAPVSHVQTCPMGMSQVLGVVGDSIPLFLSSGLLTSLRPDVRHWCFVP